MQDRICQVDETSCNARPGPYIRVKLKKSECATEKSALPSTTGIVSQTCPGPKSATIGSRRALSTARMSKDPMYGIGMTTSEGHYPQSCAHIAGPIHFFCAAFSAHTRVITDVAIFPVRGRRIEMRQGAALKCRHGRQYSGRWGKRSHWRPLRDAARVTWLV